MGEVRRDLDLAQKPLGPDGSGQVGPEDLHRHLAVMLQVLCQVHDSHSTTADLMFNGVAVLEGRLQPLLEALAELLVHIGGSHRATVGTIPSVVRQRRVAGAANPVPCGHE
jgi:hypothetical protein